MKKNEKNKCIKEREKSERERESGAPKTPNKASNPRIKAPQSLPSLSLTLTNFPLFTHSFSFSLFLSLSFSLLSPCHFLFFSLTLFPLNFFSSFSIFPLNQMGKYMKKSKNAGDVAALIMESPPPHSNLGVRTRAKTLALQNSPQTPDSAAYLQLRSRRLLKLPPPIPEKPRRCAAADSASNSRLSQTALSKTPLSRSAEKFSPLDDDNAECSLGQNFLDVEGRDERYIRLEFPFFNFPLFLLCFFLHFLDFVFFVCFIEKRFTISLCNVTLVLLFEFFFLKYFVDMLF